MGWLKRIGTTKTFRLGVGTILTALIGMFLIPVGNDLHVTTKEGVSAIGIVALAWFNRDTAAKRDGS